MGRYSTDTDELAKLLVVELGAGIAEDDDVPRHESTLPQVEERRQDLLARQVAVGAKEADGGEQGLGYGREADRELLGHRRIVVVRV